jgi:hypothetical protein
MSWRNSSPLKIASSSSDGIRIVMCWMSLAAEPKIDRSSLAPSAVTAGSCPYQGCWMPLSTMWMVTGDHGWS